MGAIEETNAKGGIDGKWQIEPITKDDGSDVANSSAAITQLIQQEKVDFILQPWVDFIAPVARGIEEKAGMPGVLSYHPSKKEMGQKYVWTFSNAQGAEDNADALVKVFAAQGWKTVVGAGDVLTIQQETLDYTAEMAPGAGIKFTKLKDQWPLDQTDFSGVASKIVAACKSANADAPGSHDHRAAGRRDDEGPQGRRARHPGHRRPAAGAGDPAVRRRHRERRGHVPDLHRRHRRPAAARTAIRPSRWSSGSTTRS